MPVKNIPKKEWKEFIDTFNRKHKNWYASIREMDENNEKKSIEENLKRNYRIIVLSLKNIIGKKYEFIR